MGKLKIEQYVVGPVQTNCYFAINDETKDTVIVDPGAQLCEVPIYAHEEEKETLESEELNACWMIGGHGTYHADVFVKDEQELDLAGLHIRVLFTPGHTKGGCCYYLPYENVVFSGDTLFQMSVGRTDLKGGSMSQIVRSIK